MTASGAGSRLRVLPAALRTRRDGTAKRPAPVGRARELEVLRGNLEAVLAGATRLVLLVGEPGIGKTRLAEQLAREAERRGALVAWGRCLESDGAPPLWPWAMVLRALRAAGGERTRHWLGDAAAVIAQVVPEVCEGAAVDVPPALSPESARFRFFDAVTDVLARAAGDRPLVVLFDDLHWADGGSLQLLQLAVQQLDRAPVLFVGSYRDVEMRLAAEGRLRAQLARLGELVPLGGLDHTAVTELVRSLVAGEPPAELVRRVHELSEGNPFFVEALVRVAIGAGVGGSLADRLATLRVPEGIRDAVRERVRPLSPATRRLLAVAALFGRDVALPLLAAAAGTTDEAVAAALDEAGRLALVESAAGGVRARFTHALIPDTLAADLPRAERAALHGRIADVLAPLVAGGTVPVDTIAAHFFEAAAGGRAAEAVAWAERAAADALARLGYEDAVRHYRRALDLLDAGCPVSSDARSELLFRLGQAERWMGDTPAARATFRRAADLARAANDAEGLARAALAHGGGLASFWDIELGAVDRDRVLLLEAALAGLGPAPSGLRALVQARLAAALAWSPAHRDTVRRLGADAVESATRLGDERVLAAVLANRHWTEWGPDNLPQRLRDAEDVIRLATRAGEPELVLQGLAFRAADLLEGGDARAADKAVERFAAIAQEYRQPRQLWWLQVYRGMRAHMAGRFDDMEAAAAAGIAVGQLAQPELAHQVFNAQRAMALLVLGRAAEVIPTVRAEADAGPLAAWRCGLASLCVGAGDLEGARREVAHVMGPGIERLPRDFLWFFSLSRLSHAVHVLDEREWAAALYAQLEPFADRVAVLAYGALCDGAVARSLGLLAATLGRADEAICHLERALEQNARIGAPALVTHTQYRLARVLLARDAAGDRARAHALLDEMEHAAEARNQLSLRDAARAVRAAAGHPGVERPGEPDTCTVEREGRAWLVTWQGRTARLQQALGFEYLVALLREPGREMHALDLAAGGVPVGGVAGDAGEMLDAEARAAYRRRLDDLRAELAEAEGFHDTGRTERAQAEIEALSGELARAIGLGGRGRRAASAAERARINVTRALGKVIGWVAAEHPALGRHLETHVRRGLFCAYTPDLRLPIRWHLPLG